MNLLNMIKEEGYPTVIIEACESLLAIFGEPDSCDMDDDSLILQWYKEHEDKVLEAFINEEGSVKYNEITFKHKPDVDDVYDIMFFEDTKCPDRDELNAWIMGTFE
jgi:hypothetical protein